MDINKIFGAFDSSSKDEGNWNYYQLPSSRNVIDENHPRYFIKMFQKLVINYSNYNNQLIGFLGQADPELDVDRVKRDGAAMLYERAFTYITRMDIQDEYHIKVLFQEANPELEKALNTVLYYYEDEEQYEKCAVLKKYLDFLSFSS